MCDRTNRKVIVASIQKSCCDEKDANVQAAVALVRKAALRGAQIVLLQELFETRYFCQVQSAEYFEDAHEVDTEALDPFFITFISLAKELQIVLPISYFEKKNQAYYNTVVVIDADGSICGKYRKSHIPDGPGYMEKFYFTPGDTGFKAFQTRYAKIGVGICWDQWFPEAARAMVLQGAEILFYPTAIGSEPDGGAEYDSSSHWMRTMQGHAGANLVPVVAANRIGKEVFPRSEITFYGKSFITDHFGAILSTADDKSEEILIESLDLDCCAKDRSAWGVFRDRRPDLYDTLLTKDGSTKP